MKLAKTPAGGAAAPETARKNRVRIEPPYRVVLLDDNDHTFEYVIEMLNRIFGYPPAKGFLMASEVHTAGRVVAATVHKELAALRQEQIHHFGADPRIPRCQGSMTAIIEPAEG
jgi:ATP-dependent Clp protease adaptor protein ClpS